MDGSVTAGRRTFYAFIGKRILDLALVLPAAFFAIPLFTVIAALVRMKLGQAGFFPPGPTGAPGTDLHAVQVSHDGRRKRGKWGIPIRRGADDPFGEIPPADEPRRTAGVLQRHPGRHEPCRAETSSPAIPGAVHCGTGPSPRSEARADRLGAGQRPERDHLGGEIRPGTCGTSITGPSRST